MPQDDKIFQLQRFLESEIPLLAHMRLHIGRTDPHSLEITAAIGPNSNHHGTAFGGSIATLGIACGWAWTHLRLQEEAVACKLVIKKNTVEYLAPVHADFTARCQITDEASWQAFLQHLDRRRRARIEVPVTTYCEDTIVAQHTAVYAALRE